MKLVDLLIKHNVQWPEGSTKVWQGVSHTLYWGPAPRDAFTTTSLPELSDRGFGSYNCTKEQYDAALAKNKAKWTRHRGRNGCPSIPDRRIEVRFRNKETNSAFRGQSWAWVHYGVSHDIMAWRYV